MNRCKWCNLNNPKYIDYHDNEWGVLNLDDNYLLEMLILEMFQAGLSWECVLNKREAFRTAYDDFDIDKICNYTEDKIKEENSQLITSFENRTWEHEENQRQYEEQEYFENFGRD